MKVSFGARWGLVLAILAGACNRSLTPSNGPTAGNGGINPSGGGGVAIAGAAGQVGTGAAAAGGGGPAGSAGAGGASASGVGGAIGGDVDGGSAGGGGFMPTGVLAPLATTDAALDQATGAQLFDLARNISYAQGWAECACLIPNSQTLSPDTLDTCARAEGGFRALFDPNESRCILDETRSVSGFDDYLRCRTKGLREVGQDYAECAMGINTRPGPGPNTCTASPTAQNLLAGVGCERAFYCADGTVAMTGRCDYVVDCADGADEHGCGELVCGDELIDPGQACDPTVCPPSAFVPPLCAPGDPTRLQCGDGTDTSVLDACNGVFDCVNGRDEAYCF